MNLKKHLLPLLATLCLLLGPKLDATSIYFDTSRLEKPVSIRATTDQEAVLGLFNDIAAKNGITLQPGKNDYIYVFNAITSIATDRPVKIIGNQGEVYKGTNLPGSEHFDENWQIKKRYKIDLPINFGAIWHLKVEEL